MHLRRPLPSLLFPALAFAATLGAAVGLASGPGTAPPARLHEEVVRLHRALFEGRWDHAAASFAPEAREDVLDRRDLRGRPWIVRSLAVSGDEGRVRVAYGEGEREEAETWTQGAGGAWRLTAWERSAAAPPPRTRRRR